MRLPNATLLFLTGCAVFSSQVLAGENLWTPTGPRERVLSLTRDGSNPGTFYALTEAGVYRSDDLGESWDLVNANLGPDRVKVLVAYPNGSGRIMAAGCGVFQSDDFGVNWTPINRGLPSDCSFTTVGLDPYHPDSVFVGGASGYYRTDFDNAGLFWTPIAQGVITGPAVLAVSSSFYGGPSRVFAAPQDGGFLYSDDRGKTWIALVPPSGVRINALTAFDTTSYQGISFVIAATDRGLFQTGDAGRTWEPTSNPLAGIAVNSLLLSDRSGRASYAATDSGLYRDTGSGWATFSVGLPEGLPMLHIFAEPAGRRLFASSVSGDQSFVNRYGNPTIAAQLTDQTVLVNQYLALQFTISPPQPGDFAFMVESSDPIAVQSPEKVFFTPFSGSGIFGVTPRRATGNTITIRARVPHDLGGAEASWKVMVVNPPSTASELSPSAVAAKSPGFTLFVFDGQGGRSFVEGSTIYWDGSPRPSRINGPTVCPMACPFWLETDISAADLAIPGYAKITVVNPPPGGGVSKALTFAIAPGAERAPVVRDWHPSRRPSLVGP